jgi:hypothetical protein
VTCTRCRHAAVLFLTVLLVFVFIAVHSVYTVVLARDMASGLFRIRTDPQDIRLIARSVRTQDDATQRTRKHICTSSGIRTHDSSVRAVQEQTHLRPCH